MQKSYNIIVSFPRMIWKVFKLIGLFEGLSIFTGDILTVLLKYKPFWNVQVLQIDHFNNPKLILFCQFNK